jgi:L-ascorbate metabolism protein UlaG (beta-lactamase superfamily)
MSFPRSDHCNGKTFFNPGGESVRGMWDVLRWKFTSRATPWPDRIEVTPQRPPPAPAAGMSVTWIGHATFLIQTARGNFLTDPVFSERASPVTWAGPRRLRAPGINFADLPRIDAVLLSHDHYDHCDAPTLRRLATTHDPLVLAPLGHTRLLESFGVKRAMELDWWQAHPLAGGIEITLTPARHWCRRRIGGTNHRLWGGFGLSLPDVRLFFAGDSAYDAALFQEIGRRLGPPDLALLPIGAYEPRWFMQSVHMNPAEAVQVHRDLGARRSVAMHWGTWGLTDEAWDEPPRRLAEARAAAGLDADEFTVLDPGESVSTGQIDF